MGYISLSLTQESVNQHHSFIYCSDFKKKTIVIYFPLFLQLVQKEGGGSLLQSLGHSLHSRERLIQVGEVMRGDRTRSCTRQSDLLAQSSLECCLSLKSLYALKVAVPELLRSLCVFSTLYQ